MSSKFTATMYVTAYQLARDGLSNKAIASTLDVTQKTFARWQAQKPALKEALKRGRTNEGTGEDMTFRQYIYNHLPPHLQDLWASINECEGLTNGIERVEALLKDHGKVARQHLFLYALTQSMFNISASMRKLNITRKTYDNWKYSDPDFAELMDEIHWHKNNFFEQAFLGRVAAGDTPAIIHAVKTKCRDRGYNDKIEIEHSGTLHHEHSVSVVELGLPVEVLRVILDALRRKVVADEKVVEAVAGGRVKA